MFLTQFWDSQPLPPELPALLDSYRMQNPEMEYRCFDQQAAEHFIAENFTERETSAFRACAVPAMQSDYFRYCAVLAQGGFYSDADTRCIAPLVTLLPDAAEGIMFQRDGWGVVNGIFAFRHPGHRLLATILEIATVGIERRVTNNVWFTPGPGIPSFLHELSVMAEAERERLSSADDDESRVRRLCFEIARDRHADLGRLFEDVHIARYPQDLAMYVHEVTMDYKQTTQHWLNWPGSIYREPAEQSKLG